MISRKTDKFTGFVLDGEKKYPFYSSDRVFHFISEGVGIFADAVKNRVSTPDKFMYGYTTDGYQVALYTGSDDKEIKANYALQPGIFFVSKANLQRYDMTTFESVQFRGGTLNNLYNNTAVRASFDENEKVFKREYAQFEAQYNLQIDNKHCELRMYSMPSDENPEIMDLCVRFEFDEELPIIYVKRIFHIMTETCRIMTNRQNVGFDSIQVYKKDEETKKWLCFAEGIANYTYDSFTKKRYVNNVLFEHLGEKIITLMEFPDRSALEEYLKNEPYVVKGIWQKIEVEAMNVVLVNGEKRS